jgi:hypothetical protein
MRTFLTLPQIEYPQSLPPKTAGGFSGVIEGKAPPERIRGQPRFCTVAASAIILLAKIVQSPPRRLSILSFGGDLFRGPNPVRLPARLPLPQIWSHATKRTAELAQVLLAGDRGFGLPKPRNLQGASCAVCWMIMWDRFSTCQIFVRSPLPSRSMLCMGDHGNGFVCLRECNRLDAGDPGRETTSPKSQRKPPPWKPSNFQIAGFSRHAVPWDSPIRESALWVSAASAFLSDDWEQNQSL